MIKLYAEEHRVLRLLTDVCKGCWVDAVLLDEMAADFPEDLFFVPALVARGWIATMKRSHPRLKHTRSTQIAYQITQAGVQAYRLAKIRSSRAISDRTDD